MIKEGKRKGLIVGISDYASLQKLDFCKKDGQEIYELLSHPSFKASITKWGSQGTGNGQFKNPSYVAVDSSGNVYVADSGNNRIQKFNSDGTFITKWGSTGTADGQFRGPDGFAIDSSGNVYVADYGNNRIQVFAPKG